MTRTPDIVSITEATAYFAANGFERDRSRVQRFVQARTYLIRGYKNPDTKRGPLVNAAEVLAAFKEDYTRQLHSGEASGLVPAAHTHAAAMSAPPDRAAPASEPGGPASTPDPSPESLPAAEDPAKQKLREEVRKRRRENAEAEGRLAPVAEIHAVLADIVPEMQQAFARIRQKHAEKLAAALKQPELAVTLAAALQDFEAAAFNRLAARMAERTVGDDPPALARFDALVDLATRLHADTSSSAVPEATYVA